ncbi:MAG: hypothetical protein U0835_04385 [Isosphaeraceae bacterium]
MTTGRDRTTRVSALTTVVVGINTRVSLTTGMLVTTGVVVTTEVVGTIAESTRGTATPRPRT